MSSRPKFKQKVEAVSKQVFKDSFGKTIRIGDEIEIIQHNEYPWLNGRRARVYWNRDVGAVEWSFQETRNGVPFQTKDNFYKIGKFKRVTE